AACGHAGGLARAGPGRIWVADTGALFEIEVAVPSAPGIGRVMRTIPLGGLVRGSFAAGGTGSILLGRYDKQPGARLWRFDIAGLPATLDERVALGSIPLPIEAQGAAVDAAGRLWITRSGSLY
ncbi:MAG TPA: hypothetical protein PK264_04390, partial [Hyphomicrobiaceae bacterium]|nr:hypothetical protein [Hyphomicrobiaceae bacterium]